MLREVDFDGLCIIWRCPVYFDEYLDYEGMDKVWDEIDKQRGPEWQKMVNELEQYRQNQNCKG